MTSHDHNFKNVFLDFPKEALEWLLPDVSKELGHIQRISFVREETQKRRLSDAHLSLDMPILFDKYVDFIDVYAGILEDERESIFHEMIKQEDTAMLAQYIKDKGFQEGRQEGRQVILERLLVRRFGPLPEWGSEQLASATSEQLDRWIDRVLEADSIQAVLAE